MNKYCIWKFAYSDAEYGPEPFIFSYKRKIKLKDDPDKYKYSCAKLLKIPSQDLIKNNRIRIDEKGYCCLNVRQVAVTDIRPQFEEFWSWYVKKIEFEAESDEEALLKYELGEYQIN